MAKLHAASRRHLPDSSFAVPSQRKLPIEDKDHVEAARGMLSQTEGLTEAEKTTAKARIAAAAHHFGMGHDSTGCPTCSGPKA